MSIIYKLINIISICVITTCTFFFLYGTIKYYQFGDYDRFVTRLIYFVVSFLGTNILIYINKK